MRNAFVVVALGLVSVPARGADQTLAPRPLAKSCPLRRPEARRRTYSPTPGGGVTCAGSSPARRNESSCGARGSALVTWLERLPEGQDPSATFYADGRRGQAIIIATTSVERTSGFPQMARPGDRIVFAWTEAAKPSTVRTAIVPVLAFR